MRTMKRSRDHLARAVAAMGKTRTRTNPRLALQEWECSMAERLLRTADMPTRVRAAAVLGRNGSSTTIEAVAADRELEGRR